MILELGKKCCLIGSTSIPKGLTTWGELEHAIWAMYYSHPRIAAFDCGKQEPREDFRFFDGYCSEYGKHRSYRLFRDIPADLADIAIGVPYPLFLSSYDYFKTLSDSKTGYKALFSGNGKGFELTKTGKSIPEVVASYDEWYGKPRGGIVTMLPDAEKTKYDNGYRTFECVNGKWVIGNGANKSKAGKAKP